MVGYPRISSTDVDDVRGHAMPRVFVPADHGLLIPEGHEAPPAPVATREGPWRRNSLDVSAVDGL